MTTSAPFANLDLPELPPRWVWKTLRELIDPERGITYGIVQPGNDDEGGIPIIRVNNIRDGRLELTDVKRVSQSIAQGYARTRLRGGEVLLTLVGSIGECAIASANTVGWNLARAVGLIPVKESNDALWVYYCFRLPLLKHFMSIWANTTVQRTFNLQDVARLPIPFPPKEQRHQIIEILKTLDDKIDANRRMNAVLEATARALFQSWFMDFDPVRAKAAGRQPYGMDAETAALFPDSFEDSVLGVIPAGWAVGMLEEIMRNYDSKRIPLSKQEREKLDRKFPYYGAASLMDYVDNFLFDGIYLLMAEDGSVRTDTGNPVLQYVWGKFWVNNHAHVLQGKDEVSTEQVYLALQHVQIDPYVTGAVQPKISQANMNRIPVILANERVYRAFSSLIDPLFAQLRAKHDESRTLAQTRDDLLPKLISGELRLGDIEESGLLD